MRPTGQTSAQEASRVPTHDSGSTLVMALLDIEGVSCVKIAFGQRRSAVVQGKEHMTARAETEEAPPTRRAILEALEASPEGVTAAGLASALGRHPNGVRRQLRALIREGSVGAERELSGRRGRPAVRYRVAGER